MTVLAGLMALERAALELAATSGRSGREIAAAELVRMGWPESNVEDALRLAGEGHIDQAIDRLMDTRG